MYKGCEKLPARILRASVGLIFFAFGVYLTVQANIGLGPWDAFSMGLSKHLPISFGTASIIISLCIVGIDLLLRERIGLGTILDAILVGETLNVLERLDLVPKQANPWIGALMMIVGLFIMSFSQYLYMSAALSCGPRDTLMVGLGKRIRRVPIGIVNILLLIAVLAVGVILGGPVGFGTLLSTLGIGATVQITFRLMRFEPRDLEHLGFAEMLSRLTARFQS